nr:helix-hairpin-helix domain-containing protein [Brevibacillus sp. SYP-B805]
MYEIWERYGRWLSAAGILLFLGLSFYLYRGAERTGSLPLETPVYAAEVKDAGQERNDEQNGTIPPQQESAPPMYADIKGSVKRPGMYAFQPNERVAHLLAKAGGLTPEADPLQVNLAQPLTDGMSIWIPAKGEKGNASFPCAPPQSLHPAQRTAAAGAAPSTGKVNINTATLQELQTLPGIGETRAQAILAYREKNGPFDKPEQLKNIAGIGDKTFERLKDRVVVK